LFALSFSSIFGTFGATKGSLKPKPAFSAHSLLEVDLAHEERLVAVMDIGTNTELILGNKHRILLASCPAGPALTIEDGAIFIEL
jgi:hypothetical protein